MKNAGKAMQRFRIPAGKAAGAIGALAVTAGAAWGIANSVYSGACGAGAVGILVENLAHRDVVSVCLRPSLGNS